MIGRYKRKQILEDFRSNKYNTNQLVKKYEITKDELQELEKTIAFRHRTINGIEEKRCKICMVWRTLDNYNSKGNSIRAECKYCTRICNKNYRIVNKEKIREQAREYFRKTYKKNKDKINKRRRIDNLTEEQKIKRRINDRRYYRLRKERELQEKLEQKRAKK